MRPSRKLGEPDEFCERARVEGLNRATVTPHSRDERDAIGAEPERVEQARRDDLRRNLLGPAVLHLDLFAIGKLAVEFRCRAAHFVRLVSAGRQRGVDDPAVRVDREIDFRGIELRITKDSGARQRMGACSPFLLRRGRNAVSIFDAAQRGDSGTDEQDAEHCKFHTCCQKQRVRQPRTLHD